jgi:hypothetical protein
MSSVPFYRSREADIHTYADCEYCGGCVDDFLRRLGNVEADVTELKVQVGGILVILPTLATKADLAELKAELKTDIGSLRTELKTDIGGLRTELKTDIGGLRTELKTDIGALGKEISSMEIRIIKWLVGTVVTTAGVAFSFAKYFH